jgi:hypothetical protein
VIGQLLAAPPPKGELHAEIEALAARQWRHPTTGDPVHFGFSTIERWYYRALKERTDPVGKLRRKQRADAGRQPAMSDAVRQAVLAQYAAHKGWSAKLHHDNLVVLSEKRPGLRPLPSYSTLRRFLKAHGLNKRRRLTSRRTEGAARAEARLFDREVRSYEAEYVGGVWHWDCHVGSKKVLTPRGEWQAPVLFGVLDDRSRLPYPTVPDLGSVALDLTMPRPTSPHLPCHAAPSPTATGHTVTTSTCRTCLTKLGQAPLTTPLQEPPAPAAPCRTHDRARQRRT